MSVTASQWAEKLLIELKLPATENNIHAILAWMRYEGGHPFNSKSPFLWNPLNTTQKMPGSFSPGGPAGVQAYKDMRQGLDATIKTLSYGFYNQIRASLAANNPPEKTLQAIKVSPWGTTAIDPNSWPQLVAQIKGVTVSGSLGFPWGVVGSIAAGAAVGATLPIGALVGGALGIAGYAGYSIARKLVR